MGHYRSDRAHAEFLLFEVLGAAERYGRPPFEDIDPDTARDILAEVESFAHERLAPSFDAAERTPVRHDPETGEVFLPAELRQALQDHLRSDWLRLDLTGELTDHHVPPSLRWAASEFIAGANPAVSMSTQLVPVVVRLLHTQGTPQQRRLAELILERHWTVTMVLTEPEAGSDVGAARTRATQQPDGSWHVTGTKRFITWASHDAAENIVHMVLARPVGVEGVGGPGTKGLSLFVVPSHRYDPETGEILGRNGVQVTGIEHKMGLAASPTCEVAFGDDAPAVATLLGDVHAGIRQMFEIITYVRMLVGLKSTAAMSSAHLVARDYASERRQGRHLVTLTEHGDEPVVIADHPDVRRSLLTQRAYAEGARALVLFVATLRDRMEMAWASGAGVPSVPTVPSAEDDEAVHRLLLPVVKTWCAEQAWRVIGQESLQTLGGSGYLRDHPIEQYARDTKIDTIYEGTTAIQGLDLLGRRVVRDGGRVLHGLLAEVDKTAELLAGLTDVPPGTDWTVEAEALAEAVRALRELVGIVLERAAGQPRVAALDATRLLMAVGDVVVGWLLLRAAVRAGELLEQAGTDAEQRPETADLRGRVAAGRWFARQVLPGVTAAATAARAMDDEVLGLSVRSL